MIRHPGKIVLLAVMLLVVCCVERVAEKQFLHFNDTNIFWIVFTQMIVASVMVAALDKTYVAAYLFPVTLGMGMISLAWDQNLEKLQWGGLLTIGVGICAVWITHVINKNQDRRKRTNRLIKHMSSRY